MKIDDELDDVVLELLRCKLRDKESAADEVADKSTGSTRSYWQGQSDAFGLAIMRLEIIADELWKRAKSL